MVGRRVGLGLTVLVPLVWGVGPGALATPDPSIATKQPSTTPTLGPAFQRSTSEQLALVDHLRRQGAVFYGAWWCPACFKQKNLFGQQAGDKLPYVECEKTEQERERCQRLGIAAYPTWVMGKERLEGVQSLERLGQWSGFRK